MKGRLKYILLENETRFDDLVSFNINLSLSDNASRMKNKDILLTIFERSISLQYE